MTGIPPHVLSGPAMPRPQMQSPEMALVSVARQRYEAAKREIRVKANTAARYYKAWEDSRRVFGPGGDPALKRTAEMEMELFRRQIESIVRPAAVAYADAVQLAMRRGRFSLAGSFSAEEGLRRLLDIEAEGLAAGYESTIDPSGMANVLDRVAQSAARLWDKEKDMRALKLGIMCVHLAEIFGAEGMPGVKEMQGSIEIALR